MNKSEQAESNLSFLSGGGEMGKITRELDWSKIRLGKPEQWPKSLQTTVGILLHSAFPKYLWWGDDLICFYNDAYRPSLGKEGRHPSVGKKGKEVWADIWETINPLIESVLKTGKPVWFEDALVPIYRNGKMEDVYWTFSYGPVFGDDGRIAGVLVTCTETTQKVQTIKELAESENRFRTMAEGTDILIAVGNETSNVIYFNNAWSELTGRPAKELLEFGWLDLIHPEDIERCLNIYLDALKNKMPFAGEFRILNKKGEYRWLLATAPPRFRPDGSFAGYISSCVDITDKINHQKEIQTINEELAATNRHLAHSNEQMRLSREAAQIGTFDVDIVAGTLEWDKRCRILFGIDHDNPVFYNTDFLNGLHPEDKQRVIETIDRVYNKALSNGDYDIEYRTVGVGDGKIRWLRAKGKAYFDENDKPIRFVGVVIDITEEKLDEIRKNDFIGMVSHELKTPLTSLSAILQVLNLKLKNNSDAFIAGAVDKAGKQIKKMNSLVNGFLNVSRLEAGKLFINKMDFDIVELIKQIIEEANFVIAGRKIIFEDQPPVVVFADREKIDSVISNLINNALKYSSPDSPVRVSCIKEGDCVKICVQDQGIGISAKDKENLFERYYRVQNGATSNISGFGIGLYLCAEIIKLHDGAIFLESEKDQGSSFYFTLPA